MKITWLETLRDWLLDQGILYAQGWLYQKAVPLSEFGALYQHAYKKGAQHQPTVDSLNVE